MTEKREIYECHDCYGGDEDCDKCFGTNRVCSICERGECSVNTVQTGRSTEYSTECIGPQIERKEEERRNREAEFQRKRAERRRQRVDALDAALGVMPKDHHFQVLRELRDELAKEK